MTSCTIIISVYESLPFLRAAVRQIRKYAHPEILQKICIIDQSSDATTQQILSEYNHSLDLVVVKTKPLYSGHGIDDFIRNYYFESDYICQVHADVVPIHKNWLYLPIKLIEENDFSFVGQLQCIGKSSDAIYPPNNGFFAMAQCYNVAKTETYKELSLEAGFTRFHNRPDAGMTWNNNDWAKWAAHDYNARGSDDDIVAFCWQDNHRNRNSLGLAVTGFIEPSFGRIIDDLVFHFGSANESKGVFNTMPQRYQEFTRRINEDYSDELIEEMVSLAKANKPPEQEILLRNYWDGVLKQSSPPPEKLNNRIEELKNGLV